MKNRQTKTKFDSAFRAASQLIARVVCLGAVILICSSAPAQNLFVSSDAGGGNIYEFTANGVRRYLRLGANWGISPLTRRAICLCRMEATSIKLLRLDYELPSLRGWAGAWAVDSADNLFVTTADFCDSCLFGDPGVINGSGKIYKLTPNGVRTTFASGLDVPTALAFDSAGNLFVANVRLQP